jgi:murein DD-endopeptidase MepM/ murein hydrolase activator NlpD
MVFVVAGSHAADPRSGRAPGVDPASDARAHLEADRALLFGPRRPAGSQLSAVCPPGSLPDRDVCVRIPSADDPGGDALVPLPGAHYDKKGRYQAYEQIPRRPDRPADYAAYLYPIPSGPVGSGYDLDRSDADQRRGRKFSHVGHGGIDLPAARGTEVHLPRLDHQEGDAQVVFVGKLFGNSVVTRHALREGGALREYIVLFGHLDAPALGIAGGTKLADGSLLGYVGDSGSEGIVHLHLEVRQVRAGVDLSKVAAERLVADDVTIVCDPRNVLAVAR